MHVLGRLLTGPDASRRTNTRGARAWRRIRPLPLVPLALLLLAALIGGLIGDSVSADIAEGEVQNMRLSSDAPGTLTIRWDTPSPAPSDYRIVWAPADQDFLSWRAPNEALRGNEYPDGSATELTLTELTEGDRVQGEHEGTVQHRRVRRCSMVGAVDGPVDGDRVEHARTDTDGNARTDARTHADGYARAHARANSRTYTGTNARADTGTYTGADARTYTGADARANTGTHSRTDTGAYARAGTDTGTPDTPEGTVTGLRLSSDAPGTLTIRWDTPSPAPSDYRIIWAPADQGFLSWSAPNEALRGNDYPDGSATSLTLTGLTEGPSSRRA